MTPNSPDSSPRPATFSDFNIMKTQLHILTRPPDELVQALLAVPRAQPGPEVVVVDLTQPDPDYAALVEKVFQSDSVATW